MKSPKISLDQWQALKAVVDEGSFARAAEVLNKSQSAVSYAIGQLNAQLPQPALVQRGRKAELSETGKVLYRRAEQLLRQAMDAEAAAQSLSKGVEAEVTIAVDNLVNLDALLCAFESFSQEYPHTRLRILETTMSATTEALLEKQADLVLSASIPVGYSSPMLMQATMMPVAAPDHPLVAGREEENKRVTESELRSHRQIVVRDMGVKREQDAGWLGADKRWTVSHFSSSVKMAKAGVGFAILPLNWIQRELDCDSLRLIPLDEDLEWTVPIYLMLSDKQAAGPASRALFELVSTNLRQCDQHPSANLP